MGIQRFIWVVERISFYALLFLLLVLVIYTLSHDQFQAGLMSGVMFILTFNYGLFRLRIPVFSIVVRDGMVVFFIPETTVCNRLDFVSRGQIIVEFPHYGLLDRPYKLNIFSPGREGGCMPAACRFIAIILWNQLRGNRHMTVLFNARRDCQQKSGDCC
jgi:hypothetical protein